MQAATESRYSPDSYSYEGLKELVLDGCKIKHVTEEEGRFLSTFRNLTVLSCSRTGLTSIQNLPSLPALKKLELSDNALTTSTAHLEVLGTATPNLRVLRLAGNRLESVDQLIKDLAPLKMLEILDVEMNAFNSGKAKENAAALAARIFEALPQLKVLDGRDAAGNEVNDEDDDEEENDEEEEDENDEIEEEEDLEDTRSDLKQFYEKDYTVEDDEDDDNDDFNPLEHEEEEDDDEDDEEEDDEDEEDDDLPEEEEQEEEEDEEQDDEADYKNLTVTGNGTTAATEKPPLRSKRLSNLPTSAEAPVNGEESKKQRV